MNTNTNKNSTFTSHFMKSLENESRMLDPREELLSYSDKDNDGKAKLKNVILDLDETLIFGLSPEDDDYDIKKDEKNIFKKFKYKNMDGYYYIFYRPGLQEFLDYLFANFNVSVWTAASKDYALFIIDKIILLNDENKASKRKLDYIFFSYHCDLSKKLKNGIKDLSILWDVYKLPNYNKNNTLIIDDNPEVHETGFSIPIKEFVAIKDNSENDKELKKIKKKLEKFKNEDNF